MQRFMTLDLGKNVGIITLKVVDNCGNIESTLGEFDNRADDEVFAAACDGLESVLLSLYTCGALDDRNVNKIRDAVKTSYEAICNNL